MAASQERIIRVRTVLRPCAGRELARSDLIEIATPVCAERGRRLHVENPATLIARAVGASHAEAFGAILDERQLPWRYLEIETEAACTHASALGLLDSVAVFPAVAGGDPGLHSEYAAAALQARDRGLVGHVIRGNVAYKVAAVTVIGAEPREDHALCAAQHAGLSNALRADLNDLLNRHLTAFNGHLNDEVAATLHSDCTLEDVALGQSVRGRTAVGEQYRSWWDALDLRVADPRCHRGEAGTVTVEAHCPGIHIGTFRGIEPTGRVIDFGIAAIVRMRDRLIAAIRIYYDTGGLLRQLSVTTDTTRPSRGDLQ